MSLGEFCATHKEAITYDLMTRTQYTLDDVGGALSWSSLNSFIKNLGSDSALARDLGKSSGWENTKKTNEILADIFDMLQVINVNIKQLAGDKHRKFKPYPRPGRDDDNKRKLGKGAMPLNELREWFRRRTHG